MWPKKTEANILLGLRYELYWRWIVEGVRLLIKCQAHTSGFVWSPLWNRRVGSVPSQSLTTGGTGR